jgi:hypothetical protein
MNVCMKEIWCACLVPAVRTGRMPPMRAWRGE